MSRTFEITDRGRVLLVRVYPIHNAWEPWICENERRLVRADVVSIDEQRSLDAMGRRTPWQTQ